MCSRLPWRSLQPHFLCIECISLYDSSTSPEQYSPSLEDDTIQTDNAAVHETKEEPGYPGLLDRFHLLQ